MADFIDLNVKNPATGSTELNDIQSSETESKLQNMLGKIDKPSDTEVSLSALNSVIGTPNEMQISLESLVSPPEDWLKIFSVANDEDVQKMAASIYKYGLLHRITVWQQNDNNFMILGGMTRTAAFKYLFEITNDEKWQTIPAKVYSTDQLDIVDAKRIFIVSNTDSRQMSVKNVSLAYYNLIKLEKQRTFYGSGIFTRDSVAKQANVSPTTFNNYLKLISLYPPLLDEIDKGNLQVMVAYEIAFLKQDLQKYIYDKKYYLGMKRQIAKIIRTDAKSFKDIDKIIDSKKRVRNDFHCQVTTKKALPKNCEILPVVINKFYKADILKIFEDAIISSDLSQEMKNDLLTNLKF